MKVVVCWVRPEGVETKEAQVPEGASVVDALRAVGAEPGERDGIGVFGRRAKLDDPIGEGDRIEICAPIIVDPREARRRRAEAQGDVRWVTAGRHGGKRRL